MTHYSMVIYKLHFNYTLGFTFQHRLRPTLCRVKQVTKNEPNSAKIANRYDVKCYFHGV